eukprot:TRINITY_DN3576_c0_g2_i1.p6 TRINITY_DN3576_c0_g2~~TRINITY_DN3576_c0_g2_i1.p6  ORF type:complete len:100 (+),score=6.35 TRINITY_DN3576_c0_g2_i1:800-1099(+)
MQVANFTVTEVDAPRSSDPDAGSPLVSCVSMVVEKRCIGWTQHDRFEGSSSRAFERASNGAGASVMQSVMWSVVMQLTSTCQKADASVRVEMGVTTSGR